MTQELSAIDFLKEPMAMGQLFAESGMFPDIKTQAQAVVKIMAGKELGLSAFQSVTGIYMVNGLLALKSGIMSSLIKRSNKYNYFVEELNDTECRISFYEIERGKEDRPLGISIFTIKDAAKAGLVNKDNWKNYPRNCLFARALSNGARWYCPDAICGYYTTEEAEDMTEPVYPQKHIIEMTAEGVTNGENQA